MKSKKTGRNRVGDKKRKARRKPASAKKKTKAKSPPSSPRPAQGVAGKGKARPKSFAQSPAAVKLGPPPETPGLPDRYGRDKLVLMGKDPERLFAHWEITPALLSAKEGEKRSGGEYREVFRLNWPARSLFDVNFAMLPAAFAARRWYLKVPYPGLAYRVELGWLGDNGHFIALLASNETEAPESWETARKRGAPADWNPGSGSYSSGHRGA